MIFSISNGTTWIGLETRIKIARKFFLAWCESLKRAKRLGKKSKTWRERITTKSQSSAPVAGSLPPHLYDVYILRTSTYKLQTRIIRYCWLIANWGLLSQLWATCWFCVGLCSLSPGKSETDNRPFELEFLFRTWRNRRAWHVRRRPRRPSSIVRGGKKIKQKGRMTLSRIFPDHQPKPKVLEK